MRGLLMLACCSIAGVGGCRAHAPQPAADERSYVIVWAADEDRRDSDFLAVIDADPGSSSYGDVVATQPVGKAGTVPHHTEHVMPLDGTLFANGFAAGETFLFDLDDPARPRLAGSFTGAGPLVFPHSFERLPNGNVLATYQMEGAGNLRAGGLAEIDAVGNVMRFASAHDATVDDPIRPYSLAVLPGLDRVVTTSADMQLRHQSRAVQIWRLSDLSLLRTVLLPHGPRGSEAWLVGEPRVLQDGKRVLVGTFSCGLYLLDGLDGGAPHATLVHSFPFGRAPECALAVRIRNYWIQTVPAINGLVSLDVTDPAAPREAARLELGERLRAHWISADVESERRLVVTGHGALVHRVALVDFDPETGELAVDRKFGDPTSQAPGVDFARESWPHGATGPAIPHGAVFSRTQRAADVVPARVRTAPPPTPNDAP